MKPTKEKLPRRLRAIAFLTYQLENLLKEAELNTKKAKRSKKLVDIAFTEGILAQTALVQEIAKREASR